MTSLEAVKTLDSGTSWLYVLSWPPGVSPPSVEGFVIPVFTRPKGVLLAVPLDLLPPEILVAGQTASSGDLVGPSLGIQCPGVQETDTGEEVNVGLEITCLLVDFSEEVLTLLREFDPVTDATVGILHFWPDLPETLPLSASLQELALEWISQTTDSRVHYYSADEMENPVFVEPAPKKLAQKPEPELVPKPDPPQKPKKVTTAALAEQLAALAEALPAINSQLSTLQSNQQRLEGALQRSHPEQQVAHKMDFPTPAGAGPPDIKAFAQAVGPPPRTILNTPLRQQAKKVMPEDEPVLEPHQDGYKPAVPFLPMDGSNQSTAQAFVQQSQAMTALVAHLIGSQDPLNDLALSGASSSSLSTKGAAKRERLQSELAGRSGNFMLSVAQMAFKRMRPTEPMPSTLQDFQGRSLFTRYFEKQGGYQQHRELGLVQWMLAHIADCLLSGDLKGAQEMTALSMVSLDQACQDNGKWEVAYLLCLLEDPPPGLYASRGRQTNPRMTAFSPICPQVWATTTLAFVREMDLISAKRSEAAGRRTTAKSEEDVEKPNPAPKRRPKFPKKPKPEG